MRRAGTHFLLHSLRINFEVGDGLVHLPPDLSTFEALKKEWNMIGIIRHPKENLISLYRFFKQTKNKYRWYPEINNTSFSNWLRGKTPHNQSMADRILKRAFEDPIQYWVDNSYINEMIFCIKYEELKNNFVNVLQKIQEEFNFKYGGTWKKPDRIGPVGVGDVPTWSQEDLELLEQKAGKRMKELNYEV